MYWRGLRPLTPALWAVVASLLLGAVAFALSRTRAPLCDPTPGSKAVVARTHSGSAGSLGGHRAAAFGY